jgi:transposase
MNDVKILAVDLAKHVFQLHGVNARGEVVLQRRLSRVHLPAFLAQLPPCEVAMEACATAHHWARRACSYGHAPRLIAPQYVKAFNRGQKNDRNDAQAIACAAMQPDMPQVPIKNEEQQVVMALHRIRSRVMKERVGVVNQLHGLVAEFGIVLPLGTRPLRRELTRVLDEGALPPLLQQVLTDQLDQLKQIEERLQILTERIQSLAEGSIPCRQLMRHRGVGPLTATAFVAEVANPRVFKNGRHVAAWLGLVPRQHSSGEHTRLLGITKRGNPYLRTLLIHGARAALRQAHRHTDPLSRWSLEVKQRRGPHRAAVALANKTSRRLWATLRYAEAA